jgi:hypothetical protein
MMRSKILKKLKLNEYNRNILIKKFSTCTTSNNHSSSLAPITLLHPISFKESKINRNAVILENEHYDSKIIFPDLKFDLKLNLANKDYTIKNMLDDSRKQFQKELVMSVSFWDGEGNQIANSTATAMLTRLTEFKICLDGGDRIYNCVNPFYLGNNKLDKELSNHIDLDQVEKLIFEKNLSINEAIKISNKNIENIFSQNSRTVAKVRYSSILKDYINNKYTVLSQFHQSLQENREKRIQKFLNFFFYMCFTQTVALNLCTFVFFNWDFMEPITTCITYLNIIFGYYFWASTSTDYELESMIYWLRTRKGIRNNWEYMLEERDQIKEILKDDEIQH